MRLWFLVCLVSVLLASGVVAISCGGSTESTNTTLAQDFSCSGNGFRISYQNAIFDCTGHTLSGDGTGIGINLTGVSHVELKNCVIDNFARGISLLSAHNTTLFNNTVAGSTYGIVIQRSNVVNLTGNNASNNQYHGVYADNRSLGATLDNNQFCSNNQSGGAYFDVYNGGTTLDTEVDPKFIEHMGIDIEPYNETTQLAGSIIFDHMWNSSSADRVFYEFGQIDDRKVLPSFDYTTKSDATIYSMANGTVFGVNYQALTDDYELWIWPDGYENKYLLNIDHVRNLTISENDTVTAGEVLGISTLANNFSDSPFSDPFHAEDDWGFIEFSVTKDSHYLCPARFFTDSTLATFNQTLLQLTSDWEAFMNDTTIHDEDSYLLPGCFDLDWPYIVSSDPNSGDNNSCTTAFNYTDTNASTCDNACPGVTTTTSTTSTTSTSTTSTTTTSTTTTSIPITRYVNITDSQFVPQTITINATDVVNWTNSDAVAHTVTEDSALFDSGNLSQGDSYTFQFNTTTNITYHCDIHPSMTGTINVIISTAQISLLIGWNLISIPLVV